MPRERAHNPRTPQRCSGSRWNTRRRTRCRYRRHHRNPLHRRRHRCGTERHGAPDTGRLALPADAPRDHVDRTARHRPGLPAPQEPGERALDRPRVRPGARLLPRGDRGALHRGAAAGRRSGRAGPPTGAAGRRSRWPSTSTTGRTSRRRSCSVAIAQASSARRWRRSEGHEPELADDADPARGATCRSLPCRGGEELAARLFEPLGYEVGDRARSRSTDDPRRGATAATSTSRSAATCCSRDLLGHLYVLLPGAGRRQALLGRATDEIDKLLAARRGLARRRTRSAS